MKDLSLYKATLAAFPEFTDLQVQVLSALIFAPQHSSSAGQLRILFGWKDVVQVNSALGRAGHKVSNKLQVHPDGHEAGDFEWWTILATGKRLGQGDFVWTLRPEVASALTECGLTENGQRSADEITSSATLIEGACRQITVNAYERNLVARDRCIEHYGPECAVCGVNLGKLYGKVAEGFIHVHHLRQLSSLGHEYEVDPIADLRPLCPNCHAVVHLAEPPHTLEQVREFISLARDDA